MDQGFAYLPPHEVTTVSRGALQNGNRLGCSQPARLVFLGQSNTTVFLP